MAGTQLAEPSPTTSKVCTAGSKSWETEPGLEHRHSYMGVGILTSRPNTILYRDVFLKKVKYSIFTLCDFFLLVWFDMNWSEVHTRLKIKHVSVAKCFGSMEWLRADYMLFWFSPCPCPWSLASITSPQLKHKLWIKITVNIQSIFICRVFTAKSMTLVWWYLVSQPMFHLLTTKTTSLRT